MLGTNFGTIIPEQKWSSERLQKHTQDIVSDTVCVKNGNGTISCVSFSDFYRRIDLEHRLAIVVDGQAQLFSYSDPEQLSGYDSCSDAIDPEEFHYIVSDVDHDGDEDIIVAFITSQNWNHEKVNLMTFENNGQGQFLRVGINPGKNSWAIASARCYNNPCFMQDAPKNRDLFDLSLRQMTTPQKNRPHFELRFQATDGTSVVNSFALYDNSTQIDFDSYRFNSETYAEIKLGAEALSEELERQISAE